MTPIPTTCTSEPVVSSPSQNMTIVSGTMSKVCPTDFPFVGYEDGERALSIVRLPCILVTVSIIASWYSRSRIGNMLLFYVHWLSGLVHLLAGMVVEQMVLLCFLEARYLNFLKFVKFLELLGGNMLATTNLAICINLALIVRSHRTVSRVRNVSSPLMMCLLFLLSVGGVLASLPFWDIFAIGGSTFYQVGNSPVRFSWLIVSYFITEVIAGLIMAIILGLLVAFRRPELRQVWFFNSRVKVHMALTVIAVIVDMAVAIAGTFVVIAHHGVADSRSVPIIYATWKMRYIHVALDTLVLHLALATPTYSLNSENIPYDASMARRSSKVSSELPEDIPAHSARTWTNGRLSSSRYMRDVHVLV